MEKLREMYEREKARADTAEEHVNAVRAFANGEIAKLQAALAAARRECEGLRAALERIFGHGYHENQHPAGQDYVSKAAIAQARAALGKTK